MTNTPLSAGRILGMMPDTGDPKKVIAFARAIERAHGITGDVIDDVLTAADDTPGVVWKATSLTGDTAHFGVRSAAKAWARSGTVEPVPLKHLRLVPLGTDCGPDCRQCGMTCRKARQIDEDFAHRLALEIECLLIDPERNRAAAEKTLAAYRAAWDSINQCPATSMGEPVVSSGALANQEKTSSSPIEDYSDCHGPDWTERTGELRLIVKHKSAVAKAEGGAA